MVLLVIRYAIGDVRLCLQSSASALIPEATSVDASAVMVPAAPVAVSFTELSTVTAAAIVDDVHVDEGTGISSQAESPDPEQSIPLPPVTTHAKLPSYHVCLLVISYKYCNIPQDEAEVRVDDASAASELIIADPLPAPTAYDAGTLVRTVFAAALVCSYLRTSRAMRPSAMKSTVHPLVTMQLLWLLIKS